MSEFKKGYIEPKLIKNQLNAEETELIRGLAFIRKEAQELKIRLLNLGEPNQSEKYNGKYQETLGLVKREAGGAERIDPENAKKILKEEGKDMYTEATMLEEIAPSYSAYLLAYLAKLQIYAGQNFKNTFNEAEIINEKIPKSEKIIPSDMLSDAILLGIRMKQAEKKDLPPLAKIAEDIQNDENLLKNYALVLKESNREDLLRLMPEGKRNQIAHVLDTEAAKYLHQSLVETNTPEEEQRRKVRMRLYRELQSALAGGEKYEKSTVKKIGKALGELGEDTRQLLLELVRDETEKIKIKPGEKNEFLPRIVKTMLDNFDDWRANDLILHLAAEKDMDDHLSMYLLGKLTERGYIPKDVKIWWREQKNKKTSLEIIKNTISELGVIPSKDILEFIGNDAQWNKSGKILSLADRISEIQVSQKEFADIHNNHDLVKKLNENENKAMMYYLLHGGDDRFNLINKYEFYKFKEMLRLISRFKIHQKPISMFKESLLASGINSQEIEKITAKLLDGQYPLVKSEQAYQEVSFEISENAALNNANTEIGKVLGKEQLGVVLSFPLYREYLEEDGSDEAKIILADMEKATTFEERKMLLEKINLKFTNYRDKIKKDLQDSWVKFGEKMVLEMTLDQVLSSDEIVIKGQELLPRLDVKRIDLKRINKDLIVALKGENKAYNNISQLLNKKKKARIKLENGLKFQADEDKKRKLIDQIGKIDEEIGELTRQRDNLGKLKIDDRFSHLSVEEKREEVDRISKEIIALTEKSPSAIFTYLAMQVLGEKRLCENDVNLIREMESHLQGPFQSISDLINYEKPKGAEKKQMRIVLEYLDKTKRFMNMVRFADSKICCFSSSNYEMMVGHQTKNKEWVASINADPMSFVISMEMPGVNKSIAHGKKVKENIGFIFGSFGVDAENNLALMLNGIYYAPGIENKLQVEAIMNKVEKIFEGLPIKKIAIASQYGGSAIGNNLPSGYNNDGVKLIRLRALDDGRGNPENKIYDDLGTGNDLNRPHNYGGSVFYKQVK